MSPDIRPEFTDASGRLPLPEGGLLLTMFPSGSAWRLEAPEIYRFPFPCPEGWRPAATEPRSGETLLIVPAGFITDFASSPGWAQSFVPVTGKHARAALLHDFLYERRLGSRSLADRVFRQQMKLAGVVWWRRWLAWFACRVAGKRVWDT